MRAFTTFVGVDLGGGKGKNTAVAVLTAGGGPVRVRYAARRDEEGRPFYDRELLEYVRACGEGTLLALDAPITLTKCLRCRLETCPGTSRCDQSVIRWFQEVGNEMVRRGSRVGAKPPSTPYTQRACELLLHRRHGILPRETFGQSMGPLTARAAYLVRGLAPRFERDENLIEVYPKATIHQLFGADSARKYKRGVDTWRVRASMLEKLSDAMRFEVWREGCLQDDHIFDAVICAYTGYLWAQQGWQLPEDHREIFEEDGWIWFPPTPKDND